ncbi:MAG: MarR family transcriptional regulator [Nanoarchaeota archaeon]|nr:MarR family transcriptional regulator [Nanoarchaeota archaeon]
MNKSNIEKIKNSPVWKQEFENWDDILDKGIMQCKEINDEDKILISIIRAGKMLEESQNDFLKKYNLSLAQLNILETLYFCPKKYLTQIELSKWTYCSKANISTIIIRMEEKQLVQKINNPKNKKEKLISLTQTGEKKLETIFAMHANNKTNLFTQEERNFLINSLNKLRFKLKNFEK